VPAAAVIPAPQAYVKAAAVKTLVVVVSSAGRRVSQKDARRTADYNEVCVLTHAHLVNLEKILMLNV